MFKYVRVAFKSRWNLLAMVAGIGVALISGRPDIVGPLVLAGEVAYLGLLGSHPKFRSYVNAQEAKVNRHAVSKSNRRAVKRILRALPREAKERFDRLKSQCRDLRKIAEDLRRHDQVDVSRSLDSLQLASLDRLLWIFLRLLFTHHSLTQFLNRTDSEAIEREIQRFQQRLDALDEGDTSPHTTKIRRTLEDNIETCRTRLTNYNKAQANHEFVELEIDRLENKTKSLAELAVNRQEHDFISTQVDQVATSMVETEKTMSDLDFATGLGKFDDAVPDLLRRPVRLYQ